MANVKTRTKAAKAEEAGQSPGKVTKTRAIAEGVRALGWKAGSEDLVGYARQKFGLKVAPGYALSIKSALKHKRRKKRAQVARELPAKRKPAGSSQALEGTRQMEPLELIVSVKELARKAGGMESLKRLVEVLTE